MESAEMHCLVDWLVCGSLTCAWELFFFVASVLIELNHVFNFKLPQPALTKRRIHICVANVDTCMATLHEQGALNRKV